MAGGTSSATASATTASFIALSLAGTYYKAVSPSLREDFQVGVQAAGAAARDGSVEEYLGAPDVAERMPGLSQRELRKAFPPQLPSGAEGGERTAQERDSLLQASFIKTKFPQSPIHVGQIHGVAQGRIEAVRDAVVFLGFAAPALLAQAVRQAAMGVG